MDAALLALVLSMVFIVATPFASRNGNLVMFGGLLVSHASNI